MVSDMFKAKAQGADVVELRLDCLKGFRFPHDLGLLLNDRPLPVIVVYRYVHVGVKCFFRQIRLIVLQGSNPGPRTIEDKLLTILLLRF